MPRPQGKRAKIKARKSKKKRERKTTDDSESNDLKTKSNDLKTKLNRGERREQELQELQRLG